MTLFILLLTGIAVGVISSFFGVGGGIITIPVLYTLFPALPPSMAIATSFGLIFLNGLLNLYRFKKLGLTFRKDIFLSLALGISFGALAGIQIGLYLSKEQLKTFFALVLIIVAIRVYFQSPPQNTPSELVPPSFKTLLFGSIFSFLGGIVAGTTGLGGGIILVPLLLIIFKTPYNQVPLYSNLTMIVGSFTGIMRFTQMPHEENNFHFFDFLPFPHHLGKLSWALILILMIGSFPGTKWGTKLAQKASPKLVKHLYIALLIIFSTKILKNT